MIASSFAKESKIFSWRLSKPSSPALTQSHQATNTFTLYGHGKVSLNIQK